MTKASADATTIPTHANSVLFRFNAITPRITAIMLVIGAVGMSIQIRAIKSHHTAPISLSELPPPETMKQKRNPMSRIAIGATARTKLAMEKPLILLLFLGVSTALWSFWVSMVCSPFPNNTQRRRGKTVARYGGTPANVYFLYKTLPPAPIEIPFQLLPRHADRSLILQKNGISKTPISIGIRNLWIDWEYWFFGL